MIWEVTELVDAPFGSGQVERAVEKQSYTGVEHIIGTAFDDAIFVDDAPAFTNASIGTGQGYTIETAGGNDLVVGSIRDDILSLGDGDDAVAAGLGDDVITLGAGFDAVDVSLDGDGHDVVTDFNPAEDVFVFTVPYGDQVDLLSFVSQTADGALISYAPDSSILVLDADMSDLNSDNLTTFSSEPAFFAF